MTPNPRTDHAEAEHSLHAELCEEVDRAAIAEGDEHRAHADEHADDAHPSGHARKGAWAMSKDDSDGRRGLPPFDPASIAAGAASSDEARYARAWRVWLEALAHDPEAAWAAAMTYRSLDVAGREAWIAALDLDAGDVGAPAIALYAPLLAVEEDPARRMRLQQTLMKHGAPAPQHVLRGLRGDEGPKKIVVLVHPLYLDFVEVLVCQVKGDDGFADVRHDPIRKASEAPKEGDVLDGVELEAVPVEPLIEELSYAVVAHRRKNQPLPTALARFVDLFAPRPDSVDRLKLDER